MRNVREDLVKPYLRRTPNRDGQSTKIEAVGQGSEP